MTRGQQATAEAELPTRDNRGHNQATVSDIHQAATATILGVVGLAGSGKSTVVTILTQTLGAPVVYLGGAVVGEVARRGLPAGEASERHVREDLRSHGGMTAVAALAVPVLAQAASATHLVIVDGIYGWEEAELIRSSLPACRLGLVAVHAARDTRESRLRDRPVRPLSASELRARDLSEIASLDKATPIALADYHFVNDGNLETLERQVWLLIDRLGLR